MNAKWVPSVGANELLRNLPPPVPNSHAKNPLWVIDIGLMATIFSKYTLARNTRDTGIIRESDHIL